MKKLAILVAFLVLLSGCGASAPDAEETTSAVTSSEAVSSEASSFEVSSSEVSPSEASSEGVSSEASSEAVSSLPEEIVSATSSVPTPEEIAAAEQAAQAAAEQAAKDAAEKEAAEKAAAQKTNKKVTGMNFRSEVEKDLLKLINEEREAKGLDPVKMDDDLQSAARIRSRELCKTGHWDHTRPNGDSWSTVITDDVPVKYVAAGENLCMTEYNDPDEDSAYSADFYMDRWLNSPSHYDNIIRPNFTHVGIGVYVTERNGVTKGYATTIFAELP